MEKTGNAVYLAYDIVRLEEKLLIDSFKRRGLNVVPVNIKHTPLQLYGDSGGIAVIRPVSMYNAMYSAAAFESMGCHALNGSVAISVAGDKILTLSMLGRAGLPVPRTHIALGEEAARRLFSEAEYPLVIKPPIGSWGRMVARARDREEADNILASRSISLSPRLKTQLVQEYVETGSMDIRCLVLGERLLGCMTRSASMGEWRSNIALGGKAIPRRPDPELEDIAVKAARIIGLEFAGIDVFEDPERGYLVNEVNGVPEFKGFTKATGVNVAEELAEYVEKLYRG